MNMFKSIWGLMLGISLLGVNRPIWAGLTSSVFKYVKAQEDRGGLKAHGRFKACSRKPALVCNLYCKLGISRDQTGHIYEPVLGLCEPTGVTRVYKGTTRRRFKDNRQQLETKEKLVCSLVIETPSSPSQLDVGFYLHRRGRTSINSLASLCPL